jgi:ATP-dependent Clp protease ATP-binding subunit ClpB
MTSNIGSVHIQELLEVRAKKSVHWSADNDRDLKQRVMEDLKGFFRPEFLNRVDDIIIFNPLTRELLKNIVEIQVRRMKKYLRERKVDIVLTDAAKEYVAAIGYDPVFGARPLKRAIQREILNALALKLLDGTFTEGQVVEVDYADNAVVFTDVTDAEVVS